LTPWGWAFYIKKKHFCDSKKKHFCAFLFLMLYQCGGKLELIVGNGPPGVHFFHTGVWRRKYKLGQTKQNPSIIFASFDRVFTSSSAPQFERNVPPGGHFLRSKYDRSSPVSSLFFRLKKKRKNALFYTTGTGGISQTKGRPDTPEPYSIGATANPEAMLP
jgi:hypothetical protein